MVRLRRLTLLAVSLAAAAVAAAAVQDATATRAQEPAPATKPPQTIVRQIPFLQTIKAKPAATTFAGVVGPRKRPSVGLVVQNGQVVVYICDGKKFEDWFAGPLVGGSFSIKSAKGTVITGTLHAKRVTGTLTVPGGVARAFIAPKAVRGKTGLFRDRRKAKRRWIATKEGLRASNFQCQNVVTAGCTTDCDVLLDELHDLEHQLKRTRDPELRKQLKSKIEKYNAQILQPGGVGCQQ